MISKSEAIKTLSYDSLCARDDVFELNLIAEPATISVPDTQQFVFDCLNHCCALLAQDIYELEPIQMEMLSKNLFNIPMAIFSHGTTGNFKRAIQDTNGENIAQVILKEDELVICASSPDNTLQISLDFSYVPQIKKLLIVYPKGTIINNSQHTLPTINICANQYIEEKNNTINCDMLTINANQVVINGDVNCSQSVLIQANDTLKLTSHATIDSPIAQLQGKTIQHEAQRLTAHELTFIAQELILGTVNELSIDVIVKEKMAVNAANVQYLHANIRAGHHNVQSQQLSISEQAKITTSQDFQCLAEHISFAGRFYVGNNLTIEAYLINCEKYLSLDVMHDVSFRAENSVTLQGTINVWNTFVIQAVRSLLLQNIELSCEGKISFISNEVVNINAVKINAKSLGIESHQFHLFKGCVITVDKALELNSNAVFVDGAINATKLIVQANERVYFDKSTLINLKDQLAITTKKITCYGKLAATNLIHLAVKGNLSFYFDSTLRADVINILCNSIYNNAELMKAITLVIRARKHAIVGCAPHKDLEIFDEILLFNCRPKIEATNISIVSAILINLASSIECTQIEIASLAVLQFWSVSQSRTYSSSSLVNLSASVDLPNFKVVYQETLKLFTFDKDYYHDHVLTLNTLMSSINTLITTLTIVFPKVGLLLSGLLGGAQLVLGLANALTQAKELALREEELEFYDVIPLIVRMKGLLVQAVSLASTIKPLAESLKKDGFKLADNALQFTLKDGLSLTCSTLALVGSSHQSDALIQVNAGMCVAMNSTHRSLVSVNTTVQMGLNVTHNTIIGYYDTLILANTLSMRHVRAQIAAKVVVNNLVSNFQHTKQQECSSIKANRATVTGNTFEQHGVITLDSGTVELNEHVIDSEATFIQSSGVYSTGITENAGTFRAQKTNVSIQQLKNDKKGKTALRESNLVSDSIENTGSIHANKSPITATTVTNNDGKISLIETELSTSVYTDDTSSQLNLDNSIIKTATATSINAKIRGTNSQLESSKLLELTANASLKVNEAFGLKAENIKNDAEVTLNQDSTIFYEASNDLTDKAHYSGEDNVTISYEADTATLHGSGCVNRVEGKIRDLNEAVDFITGHNASGGLEVTQSISLITENELNINEQISRPTPVIAVAAADVVVSRDQNSETELTLEATQKNVTFAANVITKKLAVKANQNIDTSHQRVYGTESTHMLAEQNVHNEGGFVGSDKETIVRANNGSVYNQGGTFSSNVYTQITASGDIFNMVFKETYQGANDVQMLYTPGKIIGGSGLDGVGVGILIDCDGYFHNGASDLTASGHICVSATKGIDVTCESNTYLSYKETHRSGLFKHKKKTKEIYITDVAKSTFTSGGKITMMSKEGEIIGYSADFLGADGTILIAKGKIDLFSVLATSELKKSSSSFGGLFYDKKHEVHQAAVPTRIACPTNVKMYSESDVSLKDVQILGQGHLEVKGKNIFVTNSVLKHHESFKSRSPTASFSGKDLLSNARWTIPVDPLWSKWNTLQNSNNCIEAGMNLFNLSTSAMELSNTVMSGLSTNNLTYAMIDRLIGVAQLKLGLQTTQTTVNYETAGPGVINVGSASFEAENKMVIEGTSIHAVGNLEITAQELLQKGLQLKHDVTSKTHGVDINVSPKGVGTGVNGSKEKMSGSQYENQQLSCGGTLKMRLKTWTMDAANTTANKLDVEVDTLQIRSRASDSKTSSSSFAINSSGDLAHAYSLALSKTVNQVSGINSTEAITDKNFKVREIRSIGAEIKSDVKVDIHPETMISTPEQESVHQHGSSFSANISAALTNTDGISAVASIGFFGGTSHSQIISTVHGNQSTNIGCANLNGPVNTTAQAREILTNKRHNYTLDVPQTSLLTKFTENCERFLNTPPKAIPESVLSIINNEEKVIISPRERMEKDVVIDVTVNNKPSPDNTKETANNVVEPVKIISAPAQRFYIEKEMPTQELDHDETASVATYIEAGKMLYDVRAHKYMTALESNSKIVTNITMSKFVGFNFLINMSLSERESLGAQVSFASASLVTDTIIAGTVRKPLSPLVELTLLGVDLIDDAATRNQLDKKLHDFITEKNVIANNKSLGFFERALAKQELAESQNLQNQLNSIHAVAKLNRTIHEEIEKQIISTWNFAKTIWVNLDTKPQGLPSSISGFPVYNPPQRMER